MDNTTYETERTMVLRKLRLTLHTGRLLMESMADTSRIERNMMRMADHLGLPTEKMHIFTDFHKLGLSLDTEDNNPITLFCPGERKGVNMAVINDVSHLSFKAIDEEYTVERCEEELKLIESRKRSYSPWLTVLGGGAACAPAPDAPRQEAQRLFRHLRGDILLHADSLDAGSSLATGGCVGQSA